MATVSGQRTSLSDTVGLAIDMSPIIQLIDPFDVGLLSYIGMSSLDKPCTSTQHKWREDTLKPISGTVNEALDASEVEVTLTSPEGDYLQVGDIIRVEFEQMRVAVINSSTSIDVATRGYAGDAATHVTGSAWHLLAGGKTEGSTTTRTQLTTTQTEVINYTTIFEDVVEVSSTMEAVEQWSPGSEYARQLSKVMKSLMIMIDKAVWYEIALDSSPTATNRTFNGIFSFLRASTQPSAQKVDAASAQLNEKLLLDLLLSTYDYGGVVNCFFMTLTQKVALSKFLDPARRVGMDEKTAGAVVDKYLWDQGVVDTVIDRWLDKSVLVALDSEYVGFGPLASETLGHEVLPKTSRLARKGQITGEYTVEFKSPKSSGYIHTLATNIV